MTANGLRNERAPLLTVMEMMHPDEFDYYDRSDWCEPWLHWHVDALPNTLMSYKVGIASFPQDIPKCPKCWGKCSAVTLCLWQCWSCGGLWSNTFMRKLHKMPNLQPTCALTT